MNETAVEVQGTVSGSYEYLETVKACSKCHVEKRLSEFHRMGAKRQSQCKPCRNATVRDAWHKDRKHNLQRRKSLWRDSEWPKYLERKYGITVSDYNEMLQAQDGKCAICRENPHHVRDGEVMRLCVDHNHVTGQVRGLLCIDCNRGLGFFEKTDGLIDLAASYLRSYGE